ncbi:MAG: thymidylate kinase [Candidatus Wildermuthbacteria bacterium]|nr:thymidylate kinase [Candidatus Wildermuthbacteria bacterium]
MRKQASTGKLFAFEGIDGSGKSTQAGLLIQKMTEEGYTVRAIDFPQYGKKSAGLVEEYLGGKYGSADEVGPQISSIFYAADRYDLSFQIREWLAKGFIVVTDRYVGSNMGHQGAKIASLQKRQEFFKWLYDLEYGIFQIPKPTISLFLDVPARIAQELCENPERRKKKKKDIHERDPKHFQKAEQAYRHAMRMFPNDFVTVKNMQSGKLLDPQEVHGRVWTKIENYL